MANEDPRTPRPRVEVYQDEGRGRPVRHAAGSDDRSLGELLSDLVQETRTLVRQEIQLAKTEVSEKASKAGRNAGYIGAGAAVAYVSLFALAAAAILALGLVMPYWLSSLIVGFVLLLIGYVLAQKGLKALKQENFSLERTAETLKEDKQWLKEEVT